MSVIPLNQFPSYVSAVRRGDRLDDYRRDFAFLGLTETLNIAGATPRNVSGDSPPTGFRLEVNQLTLQMFIELCAVQSPFLVGGRVGPEHVAQILWRISPEYDRRNTGQNEHNLQNHSDNSVEKLSVRSQFVASVAGLPFRHTVRAISRFLDRMFIDKPPQSVKGGGTRPDTSLAASFIHELAAAYGWSDEHILNTPMPRLFQYLRKIQREHDHELLYHNPMRDKLKARAFNKIRDRLKTETNQESRNAEKGLRRDDLRVVQDKQELVPPTHLDCTGTDGCKATTETTQPPPAR